MGVARFPVVRLKNTAANAATFFSSSAAALQRWSNISDASEGSNGESEVYKRALKLQRPTTVKYKESLRNSVSLIGVIERPLRGCNCAKFGVHTFLTVKASTGTYPYFRVLLKFWNEMAEVSVQHLKLNDLVYVSGYLGSYMKVDEDGKTNRYYEVIVTEMNFVSGNGSGPARQNHVKLEQEVSAQDIIQKRRNRLHLWQTFFVNPYEWWDNRDRKSNPRLPDFRHKDTREALWLSDNDPPWISQQLRLLDSRLSKSPGEGRNSWSNLSPLVYDDYQRT